MAAIEPDLPPATILVNSDGDEKEHDHVVVAGPSTRGPWQKFVSFIWDSDYYEKSDQERKLVFKLDCYMLSAMTLGWWIKNIDQNNLANAYVSGMKEDLNIYANQYTMMGVIYNAVVAAMQIPSNFIAIKVRPSLFLALSEIGWGIFTFAQAGARTYQDMYGFRFCVAFFESFYYPLAFFIFGTWYTRPELAKRIALWFVAGPAGSAFSGYLQAAIYTNMDGLHGLAGWRWLYIICGIMTLPVGIAIYFLVPDFPDNTRVWYLSEEDQLLAQARMQRNGVKAIGKKINSRGIFEALKSWQFWILVPFYMLYGFAVQNGVQFGVYLKAYKYSVTMRNVLPSSMYIIEIPCILIYSYISDRVTRVNRGVIMLGPLLWGLFPNGVLAFWAPSNKLRVAAFMLNGSTYITPIFYDWLAEMCGQKTEMRAFVTGSTSCLFYAFNAWLPAIVFLQTEGPRFKKGFLTTFSCLIASIILVLVALAFHRNDLRKAAKAKEGQGKVVEGSANTSVNDDIESNKA